MIYEPTEDEIQSAIAESREEGRRWHESASPEQLAAMEARSRRMRGHVILVHALKMTPDQFTAFAEREGLTDEEVANAMEQMKAPPHDDPEFKAAAGVYGGLSPR